MKRKELFEPPVVTVIDLRMSGTILAQSLTPEHVETVGQETEDFSFSGEWVYEP